MAKSERKVDIADTADVAAAAAASAAAAPAAAAATVQRRFQSGRFTAPLAAQQPAAPRVSDSLLPTLQFFRYVHAGRMTRGIGTMMSRSRLLWPSSG
jgi:hypothetical protein